MCCKQLLVSSGTIFSREVVYIDMMLVDVYSWHLLPFFRQMLIAHSKTVKTRSFTYVYCDQEKNTHSHFLLYLRGKCFDLYKIYTKSSGYVCEEWGIPF